MNSNNGEEILITEDSPTQAQMLKFLLEKHDYRVLAANNGKEALAMIKTHKPALVISDIVMPEMNGYELCRHIKETDNLKDIPVILLTALSDPDDVLKGLECGANNFVTKPYEEKHLVSRVKSILSNRMQQKNETIHPGIKILFGGKEYVITAQPRQILTLLLSTYEAAVQKNLELAKAQDELRNLTLDLETKVEELEKFNRLFVGRELRMIELKKRIEELEKNTASPENTKAG
ncbi:MAG: response regulator [Candidatus Methanoperedens sp.]